MNDLKYKSLEISRSGMKVLDQSEGIAEMIVSVYGNKDSYNERMMYGWCADSLKKRTPTGLFMHNWEIPVAKTLEARELKPNDPSLPKDIRGNGGLYIKAQYNLETQRGKDAFSDIQKGIINEFSIGYKEEEAVWNKAEDCRDVTKGYLIEWSSVVAGANPMTAVISAKSLGASKGAEIFARTKAEFLGECAEQDMTYAALCNLGYSLLWDLGHECCYGSTMPKADRIAMFSSGIKEFDALCSKLLTAILPEDNPPEDKDEAPMEMMRAEVTAHKSLDKESLCALRDGEQIESELDAFSDWAKRVKAKMSAIGSLRAKDRKKEGRVFSSTNTDKLSGHAETLAGISQEIKDMLESAQAPKALDFTSLRVRSQQLRLNGNV